MRGAALLSGPGRGARGAGREPYPRALVWTGLLAGSWRDRPPGCPADPGGVEGSEEVLDALIARGCGGLAWWNRAGAGGDGAEDGRTGRGPGSRNLPPAGRSGAERPDAGAEPELAALRDAFRVQALHARVHAVHAARVLGRLRAAGIRPVLAKGWAASRLYAHPGLRPPGDLDLYLPEADLAPARRVLADAPRPPFHVDLHAGFPPTGLAIGEVRERGIDAELEGELVRLPSPEDHLRLLALHFLVHGGWRPLWLCDVAAAVEARPPGLDWERALGGAEPGRGWVLAALALAHRLLGARTAGTPAEGAPLPEWVEPAVLAEWEREEIRLHRPSLLSALARPADVPAALRLRWPPPIEATVARGGSLAGSPLPHQLAFVFAGGLRLLAGLPADVRARRRRGHRAT